MTTYTQTRQWRVLNIINSEIFLRAQHVGGDICDGGNSNIILHAKINAERALVRRD